MADAEATKVIYIVDQILTKPGKARALVDRYLAEYAPGARERGMSLEHVLVSPPIWFDDAPNTVTVTWSLPSPLAWWQMTWQGRTDPDLARWWSDITDLVQERSRSVAAPADAVDALGAFGEDSVV
ncbi:hypothetical protein [Mycolicibacterium fortuitum]|uniref:hypothetical protein n=1 Tax=Mycolicibacterium fortuitum TaxID=1766 RepID=UPI00260E610C|nr:hypothetical protein [Mycolicibacterium fortuitum]